MIRRRRATGLAVTLLCLIISIYASAQDGPPREENKREADLIELNKLDKTIKLDIRYATANNFVGRPVYPEARAFLQRPAAEGIVRVHQLLKKEGLGLVIYDGYRPWSITKLFWEVVREDQKAFVADPAKGSKHNRGCAVDLGIYDLKTGKAIPMPSGYDEFTERASPDYIGGTVEERANRDKLRRMMEAEGFTVNPNEWWHFDLNGWEEYAIYDLALNEIRNLVLREFEVRRIEIIGNMYVKDRDIRNRIQLHEGDIFDEKNVHESVKSINRMGLFEKITDQAFTYYIDKPKKDIDFVIHLKEKPSKR